MQRIEYLLTSKDSRRSSSGEILDQVLYGGIHQKKDGFSERDNSDAEAKFIILYDRQFKNDDPQSARIAAFAKIMTPSIDSIMQRIQQYGESERQGPHERLLRIVQVPIAMTIWWRGIVVLQRMARDGSNLGQSTSSCDDGLQQP